MKRDSSAAANFESGETKRAREISAPVVEVPSLRRLAERVVNENIGRPDSVRIARSYTHLGTSIAYDHVRGSWDVIPVPAVTTTAFEPRWGLPYPGLFKPTRKERHPYWDSTDASE